MAKQRFQAGFILIADMYVAYRKAKSEAYYGNLHPSALAYTEFEQDLQNNLENLHKQLISHDYEWWNSNDFIGGFLYIPKSLDDSIWHDKTQVHYRSVNPSEDWLNRFKESGNERLDAKYRLIIVPTVAYQIVSALWILAVGHKFEGKLDKKLSYANRIRRSRHQFEGFGSFNGPVNKDSLGLFSPYFSAYKKWRQNGLDAMRTLVESGRPATAITMDLAGYYHNVSAAFLLKPSFLKKLNIGLSRDEKAFTSSLLESIKYWYSQTPDSKDRPEGALPVGLSASQVISNVLLYEFDNQVNDCMSPAYYGRYVDDVFLVFETPEEVSNGNDVIDLISKKVECLKIKRVKGKQPELALRFNYAADCELRFTADKQKIFSLDSTHGLDLIDQISSQIKAQSSEYRMLPTLPKSSVEMAEKALLASSDASLIPDALRKADVVSVRRLGMSLLVRDIESYSIDLSRLEWIDLRHQFYGLVHRHIATPKGLFDLFSYYPRVFRLMVANYDFEAAETLIENILECFNLLDKTTSIRPGRKERVDLCKKYLGEVLLQASIQASTTKDFDEWSKLQKTLKKLCESLGYSSEVDFRKKQLGLLSKRVLLADFGLRAYKDYWYYSQSDNLSGVKLPREYSVRKVLRLHSIRRFREAAQLKVPHWPALVFPTRTLTIQELALVSPGMLGNPELFEKSIFALRGAKISNKGTVPIHRSNEVGNCIIIPQKERDKVHIALTSFETTTEQFSAALNRKPDRSISRYDRINKLINDVLRANKKVDYIIFPECSVPRRWALSIAGKLAKQEVSFIAGIEYYEHKKGRTILRNDCLVSLTTSWPGYRSNLVFMQPKLLPSHGEKKALSSVGKKQYLPTSEKDTLPIYIHGNYHFGVMICSNLTTPKNRVRFQGNIDSLIVLEWNPDVKTFSYLVEGASHDIHTFVIQVNNRQFGDSRVRAPYKVEYKRDLVRLKGGVEDYFVITEIDFLALRKFQKRNRMTEENSEFKPVPIGFEMSDGRK